ncbi:hypothetical protein C8J56DRAFT_779475, partial [Mycena floridula]
VKWWTKRKRLPTPEIKDVEAFGKQWWSWWALVNPEWRIKSKRGWLERAGEGSWEVLMISGLNGLLSPLMCLRWWFSVGSEMEKDDAWVEAVAEMTWVLQCMMKSRYVPLSSEMQ